MPATFTLVVDLTAPQVDFGTPSAAEAGSLFSLPYTIDEPEVTRARLLPASGPAVELTIHADHVEAVLPPSIVGGPATVRLDTEDDVGNQATFDLAVTVLAPTAPPSGRPGPGPSFTPTGPPARRPERRESASASTWAVASSSTSRRASSTTTSLRLQSRATPGVSSASSTTWRWSSTSASSTRRNVEIAIATSTTSHRHRRRDSADEEAMLLGVWA